MGIFTKVFGTASDRVLKTLKPIVEHVNSLESDLQTLTDAELRQKTDKFRERLARLEQKVKEGEENQGEKLVPSNPD